MGNVPDPFTFSGMMWLAGRRLWTRGEFGDFSNNGFTAFSRGGSFWPAVDPMMCFFEILSLDSMQEGRDVGGVSSEDGEGGSE